MNKQQEIQELTSIITAQQRLEYLRTQLARGVNRTKSNRIQEWSLIEGLASRCIELIRSDAAPKPTINEPAAEPPK